MTMGITMKTSQKLTGSLALVVTAFLWSSAGLLVKLIPWNPLLIAGSRSLIASFTVLLILRRPKFTFSLPQIGAGLANAAKMLLFISANKYTTAANAILLQYVCPVFTAVLGVIFLREKARSEHWAGMALVLCGLTILFQGSLSGGQLFGNLLALLSALTFSIFFIFMRMQKDGSPLESILISHWITAAAGLSSLFFIPLPALNTASLTSLLALGTLQVGLASLLFSFGIKRISAINANLIAVIEPVFNPVWVFLVIRETPSLTTLAGGVIIILSVTAVTIVSSWRDKRTAPDLSCSKTVSPLNS